MSSDPDPVDPDSVDPADPDAVDPGPVDPDSVDAVDPNSVDPVDPDAADPVDPGSGDPGQMDPHGGADPTPCAYTDYAAGEAVEDLPATGDDAEGLEADVWAALYDVEDPEMPISVVDLGLVYGVTVEDGVVQVDMTLTYSGCPAREMLTDEIREAVGAVEGVSSVALRLVWNPPWTVEMVTERGREDLREFGLSV